MILVNTAYKKQVHQFDAPFEKGGREPLASGGIFTKELLCCGLFSLLLNIIIFAIFFITITHSDSDQDLKSSSTNTMEAFLYNTETHGRHVTGVPVTALHSTKPIHLHPKQNNIAQHNNTDNKTTNNTENNNSTSNSSTHSALLQILHTQIQQAQHYPQSALLLHQSGSVQVAFRLFPDGHMEGLKIIKSSSFANLDHAALAAVTAISPVNAAAAYLTSASDFYINVVFDS